MSVLDNLFDTSPEAKMAKKLGITKKTLENMFNEYDKDGSGGLDAAELQTLAASIGIMWNAAQVEEAVQAIDTDGNGVIDIKEFATWFCQQPDGGEEPSEMLKMSLQAKIFIRMVSTALQEVTDAGEGRECKNQAGFQVGDVDTENCRWLVKLYGCGSSPEEFAALNPPEDAAGAAYIDFTLRDGASEEDIQSIIDGCNGAWEMFVEPILDEIPTPPQVPGMKEGQPFVGKRIEKTDADGEDVLRFIIFTGLDPASIWRDTGLDAGDFVPSVHQASYMNHAIGDLFDAEGPTSVKDWFTGRVEYNFTWNTRTLKAARAILNTDLVKNTMGRYDKPMIYAVSVLAKAFRCQSSSLEVGFNGFQECAEAAIIDGAMNAFEQEQIDRAQYGYNYGEEEQEANPWEMLGGTRPTDEQVSNLIRAVGNLSGKTFSAIREDLLSCGPIFPKPGYGNQGTFMSPLFMIKEGLSMIPPDFAEFKDLALTFASTVSGIKGASVCSGFLKAGAELKGFDVFNVLPTREEIEASSCIELDDDPEAIPGHFVEHGNLYTRIAMAEMAKAAEEGIVPIPPPFVEKLKEVSYTDEEWAAKKGQYSELLDIIKALWAIGKDALPPGMPAEMAEKPKAIAARLLDL